MFYRKYDDQRFAGGDCLNSIAGNYPLDEMIYYSNYTPCANALYASAEALYDDFAKFPGVSTAVDIALGKEAAARRSPTVTWKNDDPMAEVAHWSCLIPRFIGENSHQGDVAPIYLQLLDMGHRPYMAMMISMMFAGGRLEYSGYGDQSPWNGSSQYLQFNRVMVRFGGLGDVWPARYTDVLSESVYYWYDQNPTVGTPETENWTEVVEEIISTRVVPDNLYTVAVLKQPTVVKLSSIAPQLKKMDTIIQEYLSETHSEFEAVLCP